MDTIRGPKEVTIYTDGACAGNPGPGGYAVVLLHGTHRKELSGGFRFTTNNRMELMAAVVGLRALKTTCEVTLYSDSAYLVNSMKTDLPTRWAQTGWKNSHKKPVLNRDLWEQLVAAAEPHRVRWILVRGHAGNMENECCDQLAVEASRGAELADDTGYQVQEPS